MENLVNTYKDNKDSQLLCKYTEWSDHIHKKILKLLFFKLVSFLAVGVIREL